MASVTHVGVPAADHVVLYALRNIAGGCVQAGYEFFRANVGGLGSVPNPDVDPPFRVRRGRHLVVTDIDWDYIHPQGAAAAGTRHELVLRVQRLGVPTQVMSVLKSATLLNTDGKGGAQASLTSGFIVSAGARLCPIVFPGPTVDPGGTSAGLQEVIVRGYLVASRR
ncbi:MAG TPA: hypothetical protein VGA81_19755 [Methylomirabilota bacterium]